jgi:hypothetical protein
MPDSTQSSGRLRRRIAKLIAMIEMPATRPAKRVMRRSFAAYASAELMKVLPEQVASIRCAHNQSFDLLEREAGIPRTLVEFDPRRVPFA